MMTNPIGGLTATNAAYDYMNSANALMSLCSFKGMGNRALLSTEQNLTARMLNDSFSYKAALYMQEAQERLAKEKAERTFSIFA